MQQQMETTAPTAAGPVKSAARALDLLDEIAANGPGTQLQLSTRLRGWLQTDPTGSVYQLGIHSLVVSSAYLDGDPVLARAASVLDEVNAITGETVHLGRLDGSDVIYTAKRESIHPLRMHSAVGRRLPAYATLLRRAPRAARCSPSCRWSSAATWCRSRSLRSPQHHHRQGRRPRDHRARGRAGLRHRE